MLDHIPLLEEHNTAEILSREITDVLNNYEITHKVFGAVTDTTSLMPAICREIDIVWMPCFCHIFNLMLGDMIHAL